jgi:hypothetical protein
MKPTIESDMKSININSNTETPSGETTPEVTSSQGRFSKNRKCVIISIVTVVILVVVAIATLIGVKFYLDTRVQIEKNQLQYGSVSIEEESMRDGQDMSQLLTYHIEDKTNDVTMWVITDMRRGIQVMKTLRGQSKMCTVTPLDIVAKSAPNGQPISTMSLNSSAPNNNNTVTYVLSDWPILDTSVLGYYAQQLCQGIDVFWSYPSCQITNQKSNGDQGISGSSGSRTRRLARVCYYQQCKYDAGSCYYVYYANDGRQYYTCRCTYQYVAYPC